MWFLVYNLYVRLQNYCVSYVRPPDIKIVGYLLDVAHVNLEINNINLLYNGF